MTPAASAISPTPAVAIRNEDVKVRPELATKAYPVPAGDVPLAVDGEGQTGYLMHWLVLGPFPNPGGRNQWSDPAVDWEHLEVNFHKDFLTGIGGERGVVPQLGVKTTIDNTAFTWEPISADVPGRPVDIRGHYERSFKEVLHGIAYLADYIVVDAPKPVILSLGSDDGYTLWVNGEFVVTHHIHRGVKLDDDPVPLSLHQGVNLILLKVDTDTDGWAAIARIIGKNNSEMPGIREVADPKFKP